MKKIFLIALMVAVGGWWLWCAENWRAGCLVAPFLMVAVAVIACGIIENNER